jgi:hypothetical protein
MSVQRIARERGLVDSTIIGHLSYYVLMGELSIDKILDIDALKKILVYFERHPETTYSEAVIALKEKYSYAILRMVREYLQTREVL